MNYAVITLTIALLAAAGCESDPAKGWAVGTTYDTDIKTVAIPVVQNNTFDREVGYLLTNALIREVESRTPWKVANENASFGFGFVSTISSF